MILALYKTNLKRREKTMETRQCKSCKGSRLAYHLDGFPDRPCYSCEGKGYFEPLNIPSILQEIKGRKGLCSKRPKSDRAYFIWRLARFHGGVDVTMPMMAECAIHGDPFDKELDALADAVAKKVFGTNMAAANRWGKLLGYIENDIPGLPATAYENGPVLIDNNKPDEELLELK
jgi:hypothetical protein